MARMHNSTAPSRQWAADQRRMSRALFDALDDLATEMSWIVWDGEQGCITW